MAQASIKMKSTRSPQARGQARRRKLLKVTVNLLDQRDLSELSLADVARAADIPLPSVYHFYRNVNELFGRVLVMFRDRLAEEIAKPIRLGSDDQWTHVIREILERVAVMSRRHRAYRQVAFNRRAPIEVRYDAGQKGGWEFVPIIETAIREHFLVPDIPEFSRILLNFLDIVDIMFVRAVEETGDIDEATLEEAERAGIAYLRLYLPAYLPRQAPNRVREISREETI